MKILVKYFLNYAEITERVEEYLTFSREEVKVKDLFEVLENKYDIQFKEVMKRGMITVNERAINQLEKEETELKDGDKVMLMPLISGG